MISYVKLCYRTFGGISRSFRSYFLDLRNDLQKAGMNYTLDEYMSTALFTSTITFVIENITLAFIFGFLFDLLASLFLAFTLSLTMSGLLFFLFYSYPSTVAGSKNSKIKKALPFFVSYLNTIASAKLSPSTLFKTVSKFKEYGEISNEADNIARDIDLFGMTFSSAIKKQAKKTPSKEFKELLWGINTMIASGGDLSFYLKQKSEEFMNDYRRSIRKYSQDLSLFVEVYLTLVITGSIFFIVLSSVITTVTPGMDTVLLQVFVVLILLPMLSIGFIVIIKSISPIE